MVPNKISVPFRNLKNIKVVIEGKPESQLLS